VGAHLLDLVRDLEYWGKGEKYPIIEDAAMLHYRAVKIHPFKNGNGRWSRMLANIWLHKLGEKLILWPEPTMGEASPIRDEYIAAIKAADQNKFVLFNELHRRYQLKS
jgi:Fic family protein